jgi:predicted TIM-barrel fold metal-dependent hydrolase
MIMNLTTASAHGQPHPYLNQIVDVDAHEMIPMHMWADAFGEIGDRMANLGMKFFGQGVQNLYNPSVVDNRPINHESVWTEKRPAAPSAADISRRLDVMNSQGIDRQLLFPTFAAVSTLFLYHPHPEQILGFDAEGLDLKAWGWELDAAHNKWAAGLGKRTGGRVRPVGLLEPDTITSMMTQAETLIDQGFRAITLPFSVPLGGLSPADHALDPFWALLANNRVALMLHAGPEHLFLASQNWSANVEPFSPINQPGEFPFEPYRCVTLHFCVENFLSVMIMGGVFERHPALAVGVSELRADWVGSLAERLDMWAKVYKVRMAKVLSMPPSQYLARNVRVAPLYVEPIDFYLKRNPELATVYTFASDFPHVEGGTKAADEFLEKLQPFDDSIREMFFRTNGLLICPDY